MCGGQDNGRGAKDGGRRAAIGGSIAKSAQRRTCGESPSIASCDDRCWEPDPELDGGRLFPCAARSAGDRPCQQTKSHPKGKAIGVFGGNTEVREPSWDAAESHAQG